MISVVYLRNTVGKLLYLTKNVYSVSNIFIFCLPKLYCAHMTYSSTSIVSKEANGFGSKTGSFSNASQGISSFSSSIKSKPPSCSSSSSSNVLSVRSQLLQLSPLQFLHASVHFNPAFLQEHLFVEQAVEECLQLQCTYQ